MNVSLLLSILAGVILAVGFLGTFIPVLPGAPLAWVYKEIQQAWSNAVAAEAKYRSSTEAATAAEDAFRLVQAKYENGKATITEFNESRNQLLKTQSDRVQATYEYLFQSRLLDFYRGDALTL